MSIRAHIRWRICATALLCFFSGTLISGKTVAAPEVLDNLSLSRVTAGTTARHALEHGHKAPISATASIPSNIVLDAASYSYNAEHVVRIKQSQSNLLAANLTNSAGADVIAGLNVVDTAAPAVTLNPPTVDQSNVLQQTASGPGHLGAYTLSERTRRARTEYLNASADTTTSAQRSVIFQQTNHAKTHQSIVAAVEQVPILEDGFVFNPYEKGNAVSIKDFKLRLPKFNINTVVQDKKDNNNFVQPRDGALATDISNIALDIAGADLELGNVRLEGRDIVIEPSTLTIRPFSIGAVVPGDNSTSTQSFRNFNPLNTLFGINVGEVKIRDSAITLDEVRIAGANPIPGITGYGGGFAILGRGSISSADTVPCGGEVSGGCVNINTTVTLPSISNIGNKFLEFTVPKNAIKRIKSDGTPLEGRAQQKRLALAGNKWPDLELQLDLEIPLNFPAEFTAEFDGYGCFSLETCGQANLEQEYLSIDEQSIIQSTNATHTYHTEFGFTWENFQSTGAILTGATADAIVLDNAQYEERTYTIIEISAGTQNNARVLNMTNAAGAVVGFGTNIAASRTYANTGATQKSAGFTQHNSIHQIGRW